jgi:putative membrane protein
VKVILRYFLINLASLWITTELVPGLVFTGGIKSLLIAAVVFALINVLLVPILKIVLLPLNLLTLGLFAWVTNVIALYVLTSIIPQFRLMPFAFQGFNFYGFSVPEVYLSTLWVAILASLLIGLITHFLEWLMH